MTVLWLTAALASATTCLTWLAPLQVVPADRADGFPANGVVRILPAAMEGATESSALGFRLADDSGAVIPVERRIVWNRVDLRPLRPLKVGERVVVEQRRPGGEGPAWVALSTFTVAGPLPPAPPARIDVTPGPSGTTVLHVRPGPLESIVLTWSDGSATRMETPRPDGTIVVGGACDHEGARLLGSALQGPVVDVEVPTDWPADLVEREREEMRQLGMPAEVVDGWTPTPPVRTVTELR